MLILAGSNSINWRDLLLPGEFTEDLPVANPLAVPVPVPIPVTALEDAFRDRGEAGPEGG